MAAARSPNSTTLRRHRRASRLFGATPERLVADADKRPDLAIAHDPPMTRPVVEAALAGELSRKDREARDRSRHALGCWRRFHGDQRSAGAGYRRSARSSISSHGVRPAPRPGRDTEPGRAAPPDAGSRGEPRELALDLIAENEGFDRGCMPDHSAGSARTATESLWCLALRSSSGRSAALFAGCGIVADSDPAREWTSHGTRCRSWRRR